MLYTAKVLPSRRKLCSEFTLKIYHARINKFFSASQEVHLEESGKVVHAEQGLQDRLKAMKIRS